MADLKKIAEEISKLTLIEAVELKNILKEEYGIEPAAGGAVTTADITLGIVGGSVTVSATIRTIVVKLEDGTLWVNGPQWPTGEFCRLLGFCT